MKYLAWLEEIVGAKLRGGAIGKPVFLRANLQLISDHGHLIPLAAAVLDMASQWIGSPVRSIYSQGGMRQGFVSLLVEFAAGQSALVTAELTQSGAAETQLLIVGQHGTLRFDDFPEPLQVGTAAPSGGRWLQVIEASLKSGDVVLARE